MPGTVRTVRTWIRAVPPFRLDLTVSLLQRLPLHPVEVWSGGRYCRAFETPRGPVAWVVRQRAGSNRLSVELHGPVDDTGSWRARIARALGTAVDLSPFYRRASRFPDLAPMVRSARGVKPPRFQALHEALASVILFQQVSLTAAVATLRRIVVGLSKPVQVAGVTCFPFPSASAIASCSHADLRSFGMTRVKARTLRDVASQIVDGVLDEDALDSLPSESLEERLRQLPGVGPWSAALLVLRGFGRLDRFPPGDVVAERLLRDLGSPASARALLSALGDTRGMLYYHLFLHRLAREQRGPFAAAPPGGAAAGAAGGAG